MKIDDISINGEKYLRLEDVLKVTEMKQSTLYALMKYGHFPASFNMKIRALWKRSEIEEYIESQRK